MRAAPDGYTLLFTGSNDAWNTALYDNLSFNYVRDIAPVASISKGMGVLVVPPSFPARTVHEFIAYARDNPAKVTIASDGVGSGPHVFWELFRSMTGLNTLHVPYRGAAPVIIDLLGAQVQAYFGYVAPLIEYIRRDQLHPLAVTSAMRVEDFSYFVSSALADCVLAVGAAGEITKVTHVFQPSGRFSAANSL